MTLGQFYTPELAGGWLVQGIGTDAPAHICDLGAGEGELLLAAQRRWGQARLLAADIDPANVFFTRQRLRKVECRQVDVLRHDLPRLLGIEEGTIDVALGNPPYGALDVQARHLAILRDAGLDDAVPFRRITRDIIFLAQNLRLLKSGGELAIILPEGLAVNRTFEELRIALMELHGLHSVIELPSDLFQGTEARTVAMFLKKGGRTEKVRLESTSGESILVHSSDARKRLDARFHLRGQAKGRTLGDLNPTIHRGALTHAQAIEVAATIFHTTTFKTFPNGRARLSKAFDAPERWVARSGDILVPRVGSRCLSPVAFVERGMAIFTDCVYRIRVSPSERDHVCRALRSVGGVTYRLTAAHGTCAAVLSKADLLGLPLG